MSKLHIFIDGSWLFKVCGPEGVLASKTDRPTKAFPLNFSKLNISLLQHAKMYAPNCTETGALYYSTSIFNLPEDFDEWPNEYDNITTSSIEVIKRSVYARNMVAKNAIQAGYFDDAIYHPQMKGFIVDKLISNKYQEKQVDASIVALLVRSAITCPDDYHVVITGDSDILPAIRVAYPEYSKNVFVATSHPDELNAAHRQTSFSFQDMDFETPPYYFQQHVADIIHGNYAYHCAKCNSVFTTSNPVPEKKQPYCSTCLAQRS